MRIPVKTEELLRKFYSDETMIGKAILRCVVTGTPDPDWHHLDDNHENNDPGNIIPLAPRLNQYLGGLKTRGSIKDELLINTKIRPTVLIKNADLLAEDWHFARAVGCLRLALYLSKPPFHKKEDNDHNLAIACMPIRHLRHYISYEILNTTLYDVFKILIKMKSVRVENLINLKYNLIAILNEHGLFRRASDCAQDFIHSWHKEIDNKFSPDMLGSIKRRVYQIAIIDKNHFSLKRLLLEIEEIAQGNIKLDTSIANTKVLAALHGQNHKEIKASYEHINKLCIEFEPQIEKDVKPGIGSSDLAEIFLYKAILALIVKPPNYHKVVEKSCRKSDELFSGCHALITYQYPDFWVKAFQRLSINLKMHHPVAQLMIKYDRPNLPLKTSNIIDDLFKEIKTKIEVY